MKLLKQILIIVALILGIVSVAATVYKTAYLRDYEMFSSTQTSE